MFSSLLGIGPQIIPQLLAIATLVATILICGCSLGREPGPAERIGRSIDEISDALEDMNTEDGDATSGSSSSIARRNRNLSAREAEAARLKREREMSDEEFWSQDPEPEHEQMFAEPFLANDGRRTDRY